MQVLQLECLSLLGVTQDLVCQELLEDLSVVNLLLNCASSHEAVDFHLALLSETPCTLARLDVSRGIPIRVIDDYSVGTSKVHTKTANLCRQQKDMQVWIVVELVDQVLAIFDRCVAVHTSVIEALHSLDEFFHDVKHDAVLCE